MARRVGLVVGVARTTVTGYPALKGIDIDVDTLQTIFGTKYDLDTIPNDEASVSLVNDRIVAQQKVLVPGDTFLFAYSGHGAQHVDSQGVKRESIVLRDGHFGDVMLRSALHNFEPGVHVIALIDACHAAGVVFLEPPTRAATGSTVWQRAKPVPGASSLTFAAAPENELAKQTSRSGGQLTDCLRRAHLDGATNGTWRDLWESTSAWAKGCEYRPLPQAWLDGPDGSGDAILDVSVF